jgi:hypothetical protein
MRLNKYPYIWLLGIVTVAVISFLSSLFGAWLSSRLSRKRAIEEENRNVRKNLYRDLYFAIIEMAASGGKDPGDGFFRSYNSILFYAPDSLLQSIVKWKKDLDANGGKGELNSPLMKKVLDEMRNDLSLSKKDLIAEVGFTPVGRHKSNKSMETTATSAAPQL